MSILRRPLQNSDPSDESTSETLLLVNDQFELWTDDQAAAGPSHGIGVTDSALDPNAARMGAFSGRLSLHQSAAE